MCSFRSCFFSLSRHGQPSTGWRTASTAATGSVKRKGLMTKAALDGDLSTQRLDQPAHEQAEAGRSQEAEPKR